MALYRSRRFVAGDEDAPEGPLRAALDWAHAGERPFLVLAHETERTVREYEALDETELARWAREPSFERHAHEVVAAPAKLYADFDHASLAAIERLTLALEASARERFDVVTTRIELDASRGAKTSRHLVLDMHNRGGNAVRFATNEHVGAFIADVARKHGLEHIVDVAVYRRNNCVRTYGSSKRDDPTRPFTLVGVPLRRDGTLEYATLASSLITWPRAPSDVLVRVDIVARVPRAMKRAHSATITDAFETTVPEMAAAGVRTIERTSPTSFIVKCTSRVCERAGREHKSNTIYFIVNLDRRQYAQGCYSPHCSTLAYRWRPAPSALVDALNGRVELTCSAPARLETYGRALESLF